MTENFSTVILVFPQVTEVDKREPKESFLKPKPQAKAEKCSPRFPFVYSNTSNSALFGIQNLGHYSKKALIEVTVI